MHLAYPFVSLQDITENLQTGFEPYISTGGFDPYGLDVEDVVVLPDNKTCIGVDEYAPSLFTFNCDFADKEACGTVTARYSAYVASHLKPCPTGNPFLVLSVTLVRHVGLLRQIEVMPSIFYGVRRNICNSNETEFQRFNFNYDCCAGTYP